MAGPYYVDSSRTGGADTGGTWADAFLTLIQATAVVAAGERIYVASGHAETPGSTIFTMPNTPSDPPMVLSVNASGDPEPPTALLAGASIIQNASGVCSINGFGYFYGLTFGTHSASASTSDLNLGYSTSPVGLVFEECAFQQNSPNSSADIKIGAQHSTSADDVVLRFVGCTFSFAHVGQYIRAFVGKHKLKDLKLSGTAPTNLFSPRPGLNLDFLVEASDLTGVSWSNLVVHSARASGTLRLRNCKLPAGISFASGTPVGPGTFRIEAYNCDSADTNYVLYIEDYMGTIVDETTIVLEASDGTTTLSWEMVSSAAANKFFPLVSCEIYSEWNEDTGSAKTVTVEIVTDNVTLQDDEIWIEVQYLGTSGFPQGSIDLSDRVSNLIFATPANQATSTAAWTTTGLTTPLKQKLEATFTPQEKGVFIVTVHLAKVSTTVYVDPKVTIS